MRIGSFFVFPIKGHQQGRQLQVFHGLYTTKKMSRTQHVQQPMFNPTATTISEALVATTVLH